MKPNLIYGVHFVLAFLLLIPLTSIAQVCKRANIVLIIGDDLRYDSFAPTGGPSFFDSPAINRIADEGARFDNYFCVYSLCIPSRASMMTGLYPHSHGAVDNCTNIRPELPTVARILDSAGYNTAMIGKYHIEGKWKKYSGWDYWFATKKTVDYTDPNFFYYMLEKQVPGNVEDIIADTVHKYLSSVDTPFFVSIGHLAPHRPVTPLPQYDSLYEGLPMPVPSNFGTFAAWYPNFIYNNPDKIYKNTKAVTNDYERYFEGLKGVEDNVADIFSILAQRNLLNKTMIIFVGDNGAIYGEHQLKGKVHPYEPSIHLPLFIRYPSWYPDHTVFGNENFYLNIDLMPTMLDAACISSDKYNPQGVSFQKLTSGEVTRTAFLYESIKIDESCDTVEDADRPSLRSVRTNEFKYNRYQCDHSTEELFDLVVDPMETKNVIKETNYSFELSYMRDILDSLLIFYHDTLAADSFIRPCWLAKTHKDSLDIIIIDNPFHLRINPTRLPIRSIFLGKLQIANV
jgi:N-acetylglucosamine-6-sulfatase